MWQRFDIVQLLTTKNITYLSGPPGRPADPQGNWSVVGNLPGKAQLLLAKDETLIAVSIMDVRKVGSYNLDKAIESIKKVRSKKDLLRETTRGKEE